MHDGGARRSSAEGGVRVAEGGVHYAEGGLRVDEGGVHQAEGGPRVAEGGVRYAEGGVRYGEGGVRFGEGGVRYAEGGPSSAEGSVRVGEGSGRVHDLPQRDEQVAEAVHTAQQGNGAEPTPLPPPARRQKGRGFAVEPAADAAPPAIDPLPDHPSNIRPP